jgi:hypothetical protein
MALVAGLLVAAGAGGAVAGTMVTGKQIKDGTVTSRDIKDGTLKSADVKDGTVVVADLAPNAVTSLRGATGPAGVSGWQMVQVSTPARPAGTLFTEAVGECPDGTKLLSAAARWHEWNQSEIALSYAPDGSGATATSNNGSTYDGDYIDLTLVCAVVTS